MTEQQQERPDQSPVNRQTLHLDLDLACGAVLTCRPYKQRVLPQPVLFEGRGDVEDCLVHGCDHGSESVNDSAVREVADGAAVLAAVILVQIDQTLGRLCRPVGVVQRKVEEKWHFCVVMRSDHSLGRLGKQLEMITR